LRGTCPVAAIGLAPWFQVQSQVAFGGSFVTVSADVKNICTTVTHTGTVTLTLVKTWPYYTKMLTRTWVVSLKPQASVNLNPLPNAAYTLAFGHYVVTTTAVHIWQFRDTVPGGGGG
jgi:hypothetical protein